MTYLTAMCIHTYTDMFNMTAHEHQTMTECLQSDFCDQKGYKFLKFRE